MSSYIAAVCNERWEDRYTYVYIVQKFVGQFL